MKFIERQEFTYPKNRREGVILCGLEKLGKKAYNGALRLRDEE